MKLVKRTASHAIYQRRDGRYAVRSTHHQAVNGEEKVKILLAEGLLTAPVAKAAEPEPAAEAETAEAEDAGTPAQDEGTAE